MRGADMRSVILFGAACLITVGLAGCAAQQRAEVAQDAQLQMRGLPKEQVLGCMGPPGNKAAEGATEVWSYESGGEVRTAGQTLVNNNGFGGFGVTANSTGIAQQRYCIVNVTMIEGKVSALNYTGPSGGPFTAGEQCAYAVRNCVRPTQ